MIDKLLGSGDRGHVLRGYMSRTGLRWLPVIDRGRLTLGQVDAADSQFFQDEYQITVHASFSGDQAIQCTPQPAGSSGNILPETTDVASLLIKPYCALNEIIEGLLGDAKPSSAEVIVQKTKSSLGPAYQG